MIDDEAFWFYFDMAAYYQKIADYYRREADRIYREHRINKTVELISGEKK